MATRRHVKRIGWPEVLLAGIQWTILLAILLVVLSVPEVGGWPGWLWIYR
jgi:hypothetical protein